VCVWYLLLFQESWVVFGRSLGMRQPNQVARSLVPGEGVWNWDCIVVNHFFIKFWGMGTQSSCITNYFSVVLLPLFLPLYKFSACPLALKPLQVAIVLTKFWPKKTCTPMFVQALGVTLHTWSGMVLWSTNRHIIVCGLIWNGMSEILLTDVYCMKPKPHSASM